MDEQDALRRQAALELVNRHGWDDGVAASVMLSITSVVDLAPKEQEHEVLELHGPWFKHPDGRFVDWSELPESEKARLRK